MKKLVDQWDKAAKKYTQDQEQSDFVEIIGIIRNQFLTISCEKTI